MSKFQRDGFLFSPPKFIINPKIISIIITLNYICVSLIP
jgi:hypothetical protein